MVKPKYVMAMFFLNNNNFHHASIQKSPKKINVTKLTLFVCTQPCKWHIAYDSMQYAMGGGGWGVCSYIDELQLVPCIYF